MTKQLGILGGGQLGKMLIEASTSYDVCCHTLDPESHVPATLVSAHHSVGNLRDPDVVFEFGKTKDCVTAELEFISVDGLVRLEDAGVVVYPQSHVFRLVQDKGLQKQFFKDHDIPTAPFILSEDPQRDLFFPCVQKSRVGGYDGRGVCVVDTESDREHAFLVPSVIEEKADIDKEISVIVARDKSGNTCFYDPVEMVVDEKANLLDTLIAPARISEEVSKRAIAIALNVINSMEMIGLLAVEMFVCKSGEIWVNEVAPRPHNSGHHTIEAVETSQYEQLCRILLDLPLGSTKTLQSAVMINVLGEPGFEGKSKVCGIEDLKAFPNVFVHMYGKSYTKPFRKMGHITVCRPSVDEALVVTKIISKKVKVIS